VLRSKVLIEDLSDRFAVLGRFASPPAADGASPVAPASPPAADGASPAADAGAPAADGAAVPADAHHDQGTARGYVERDGIGFAPVGSGAGREWAIGELRELERHGLILEAEAAAAAEPASHMEHDWRLADIRAGLPQIYAVTRELFVAQMLNLDLIDGISFTKGCFTGQEIIARTQHLGRIKRRLHRLRLPAGTWAVGQAVQLSDGRSGRLTELARTGAGFEALAVLSLEPGGAAAGTAGAAAGAAAAAVESATAERIAATELPLPYQLGS
jgi:folate-binding protein YgfZ